MASTTNLPSDEMSVQQEIKLVDEIQMVAAYGSEKNTDAQAESLLQIGQLARGEREPIEQLPQDCRHKYHGKPWVDMDGKRHAHCWGCDQEIILDDAL